MMRIATWNLERASTRIRREGIMAKMVQVNADIWILTETDDRVSLADPYACLASTDVRQGGVASERWVTIWSRFPGRRERTSDPDYAACAIIDVGGVGSLAVYGTVLPWRGSSWREFKSAGGAAFRAAISAQAADWRQLAASGHKLCVAGDFNQDLSDTHYYWSANTRHELRATLSRCGVTAMTAGDRDPVRQLTSGKAACIDHICLSSSLAGSVTDAMAIAPVYADRRLSDHPCIVVEPPPCPPCPPW